MQWKLESKLIIYIENVLWVASVAFFSAVRLVIGKLSTLHTPSICKLQMQSPVFTCNLYIYLHALKQRMKWIRLWILPNASVGFRVKR